MGVDKDILINRMLDKIRNDLLDKSIYVFGLLATPTLILSLFRVLDTGWQLALSIQLSNFCVLWTLYLLRYKLKVWLKGGVYLSLLLMMGVAGYYSYALASAGPLMCVTMCIITAILYGEKRAYITVATLVCITLIFPISIVNGWLHYDVDFELHNLSLVSWSTMLMAVSLITCALIVVSDGMYEALVDSLKSSFVKAEKLHLVSKGLEEEIVERKHAELSLRKTEDKFSKIFRNNPSIVFVMFLDNGIVLDVNKAFEEITGYARNEIVGRTFVNVGLWESMLRFNDIILHLDVRGFVRGEELRFKSKNGSSCIGLISIEHIEVEGRKCALCAIEDITDQYNKERDLSLRNVLLLAQQEVSLDGILAVDEQGKIISYNRRFMLMWAIPQEVVDSKSDELALKSVLGKLVNPDEFIAKVAYLYDNNHELSKDEILLKDGHVFERFSSPMFADDSTYYGRVWYFRDITERKRIEKDLEKYRLHLEELVSQRTVELVAAKERAEAADKMKSSFLATMSHELRTPLNSVIGFSAIMLKEQAGEINEEQRKQLGMINSSASHLLNLVNDVLDVIKLESGKLSGVFDSFDLKASVDKSLNSVSAIAKAKNLALNVEYDTSIGWIYNDHKRVEQVITNLLSNAIKFTEKGSVTLVCKGLSDKRVLIKVEDTGIGIREEDFEKLFKPFVQLDSEISRSYEGTGLGLYISKRILEILGADIRFESEFGKGSVFEIMLPSEVDE